MPSNIPAKKRNNSIFFKENVLNPIIIEIHQRAITKYNGRMTSRRGGIFLRPEVRIFESAVRYKALKVFRELACKPFSCPLRVDIDFHFSNNKMPDLFNLPKAVCDALNTKKKGAIIDEGVWLDDRQIIEGHLRKINSGFDGIIISIYPKPLIEKMRSPSRNTH
jgi:Holliday junction resolvase RusA-like endonuclease